MSTTITIAITVGDEGYTAHEQAIIASLAAHPSQGAAAVVPAAAPAAAPKAAAPAKPKPDADAGDVLLAKAKADLEAKKAVEAARVAVAEAEAAVEAAEKPVEEPAEDLVGDSEAGTTYTLEDAVAEATKLVSSGRAAEVKSALAQTSAKKVSELKGADLNTFMTVLVG